MNKKGGNFNQMRKPQIITPVTYPELKKNLVLLDKKIGNRDKIAKHSIDLFNKRKTSIYKKLFNRLTNKDTSFNAQEIKTIRNMYLKRLVESNSENFPIELSYDEYKANVVPKEDKIKSIISKLKEAGKTERIKKDPLDLSRNSSMVRRESIDEQMLKKEKEKRQSDRNKKESQTKNEKDIMNNKDDTEDEMIEEEDKEQEKSYDNDNYINENMDDDSQNINYDKEEGDIDEGGEF